MNFSLLAFLTILSLMPSSLEKEVSSKQGHFNAFNFFSSHQLECSVKPKYNQDVNETICIF